MSYASSSREQSPIAPHPDLHNSVFLQNLSPRASTARSSRASLSPPPSFYRDLNSNNHTNSYSDTNNNTYSNHTTNNSTQSYSDRKNNSYTYPNSALSPSPSRTRDGSRSARRIQFAAPPPPIASSVFLSPQNSGTNTPRSRSAFRSSDGRNGDTGVTSNERVGGTGIGRGITGMDPLLVLERRERAIQNELQELLDAQAVGLVQGFGGQDADAKSEGSSTPTSRSQRSRERGGSGVMPVRQPKRKVLGLRGARRALLRDMGELVGVKEEEMLVLEGEIERRKEVLERVAGWEERIEGVRKQLVSHTDVHAGEDGDGEEGELVSLRKEENKVDLEIRETEERLAALKAKKRWLGDRIEESVNQRDAKMSSYRGALKEVEKEVKDFLRRPIIGRSVVMGDEKGFDALPPARRTLGLAREWWSREISVLTRRKEEVEREKKALEEGEKVWKESVDAVVGFEDELRRSMASAKVGDREVLGRQIEGMGGVIRELVAKMGTVEEKGWNLLICAVGAELEAFREGEAILKGALGMVETEPKSPDSSLRKAFKKAEERNGNHSSDGMNGIGEGDDTDTDSVLNELNTGAEMDGSKEIKARGLSVRNRTSFGSEMESDEGPNLQELMVEEERR